MSYWKNIESGIKSMVKGLGITFRHLKDARNKRKPLSIESNNYFDQQNGIVTLQYPHESLPIPDNGRYRLNNEIDDCIVCDLCAKICPVNCIEIEPIKSAEEIGKTSDGSTKRIYAGKFDIDMAKCCYCGLCTTVCPTECLTMTKTYDFSEFDIRNMVYHFTDLTPEQAAEKQQIYDESQRLKAELKKQQAKPVASEGTAESKAPAEQASNVAVKPAFKPKIAVKPQGAAPAAEKDAAKTEKGEENQNENNPKDKIEVKPDIEAKPVSTAVKPVIKPKIPSAATPDKTNQINSGDAPKAVIKPVIKPVIKKPADTEINNEKPAESQPEIKGNEDSKLPDSVDKTSLPIPEKKVMKPIIKPVIKPLVKTEPGSEAPKTESEKPADSAEEKKVLKPVIKPVIKTPEKPEAPSGSAAETSAGEIKSEEREVKPEPKKILKPVIKPVIKPKPDTENN